MDFEDDPEHFSLRWNNYNDTMKMGFHDLLQREDFVDVTIAAEGKLIQAHKMVLSICSPYFKTIFKTNPCQHPVVFLKDVTHKELSGILQFMYVGEVSIKLEDLKGFLRTAEALQIKGLSNEDYEQALTCEYYYAREDEETRVDDDQNKTKVLPLNDDKVYDDDMDDHDQGSVEPKKMKMSSADDGLAQVDPHVPVIKTPERPAVNSNTQPSQPVKKDEPIKTDCVECKKDVAEETDKNGDNKSSDKKEEFTKEVVSSLPPRNSSETAQDVNNPQPVAEICTPEENQQGTEFPTRLTRNQGLCPICGRILQHKKNLQTHILDQHSGIFGCWPCQICHRVCRTWSALRVHTNRHHLNLPPAAVQMSIIGIPQQSN